MKNDNLDSFLKYSVTISIAYSLITGNVSTLCLGLAGLAFFIWNK